MGTFIYQLYFTFQGSIIFAFISYLLYTLCKPKRNISRKLYVMFSFWGFFVFQKIIDWFITNVLKKSSPYCVFLLSVATVVLISSFVFLQSSAFCKITYILFFLLGLLCVFFCKVQIVPMTSGMPKKMFLILYFPVSILLSTLITSNTPKLWVKFAPILAAIIITNLPIIYYFFCGNHQLLRAEKTVKCRFAGNESTAFTLPLFHHFAG